MSDHAMHRRLAAYTERLERSAWPAGVFPLRAADGRTWAEVKAEKERQP